jgi:hypothetical protein
MTKEMIHLQLDTALCNRLIDTANAWDRSFVDEVEHRLNLSFEIETAEKQLSMLLLDCSFAKFHLGPGDKLLCRAPAGYPLSAEQMSDLRSRLKDIFGDAHEIIIVAEGFDLTAA